MEKKGQYSKDSRRITHNRIKIPPGLPQAPKLNEDVREEVEHVAEATAQQTIKMLDKDRLVFKKQTGWLIASLVVTVLSGAAYLGSAFFTREHQVYRLQQQVREMSLELEVQEIRGQRLERRIVELETQLELL